MTGTGGRRAGRGAADTIKDGMMAVRGTEYCAREAAAARAAGAGKRAGAPKRGARLQ